MATLTIKITHVAWRGGRPRFEPGPALRALGFRGEDLRHGSQGPYLTAEEALAWSAAKEAEIAACRQAALQARAKGKSVTRAVGLVSQKILGERPRLLSVEGLFEVFFAAPRMRGQEEVKGKRRVKPKAPATVRYYRQGRDVLARFDPTLYGAPVEALSQPIVFDLYERLHEELGLASARMAIAALSVAISWGKKRGRVRLVANPCFELEMETLAPRVRAGTPEEVRQLIAAADLLRRPEVGDSVTLGVWTGQRQNDRLDLIDVGLFDGRRRFRQAKTGAIVEIREAPELAARLAAAKARRTDWRVQPLELVIDERQGAPFRPRHYREVFAEVREAAAAGIAGKLDAMPSLADFRDQDLRDTAVTWLARAQCTPIEIAQITGHSLTSIQDILKHYLAAHREIGDNAIRKAVAWYEAGATG